MDISALREKLRSTGESNLKASLSSSGLGGSGGPGGAKQAVIPWNILKVFHRIFRVFDGFYRRSPERFELWRVPTQL